MMSIELPESVREVFIAVTFSYMDFIPFDEIFAKWGIKDETKPFS